MEVAPRRSAWIEAGPLHPLPAGMSPVPLPFPCVLLPHGRVPDERHVLGVPLLGGAGIVVAARDNRGKINDNELVVHDGVFGVVAHVHARLSQPAALVAPAVPAPGVQHHPHIHISGMGGDEGVGNGRAGEGVGRHTDGGPGGVEGLNEEGIAGSPGREADGHGRGDGGRLRTRRLNPGPDRDQNEQREGE